MSATRERSAPAVPEDLMSMIWVIGDLWLIVEASMGYGYHWGISAKPYV